MSQFICRFMAGLSTARKLHFIAIGPFSLHSSEVHNHPDLQLTEFYSFPMSPCFYTRILFTFCLGIYVLVKM
ncbi:hypothetical protein XELAEV_18039994mg [Xenopus laevis]|uniref:Uncharacterized protein n=1 Tax=Xenopus laevis TaxID=8355 RepID=A0A974C9P3_XENLA|nr:hypothetical protein XELAEV_18039994mg [Xenopus laevis]